MQYTAQRAADFLKLVYLGSYNQITLRALCEFFMRYRPDLLDMKGIELAIAIPQFIKEEAELYTKFTDSINEKQNPILAAYMKGN